MRLFLPRTSAREREVGGRSFARFPPLFFSIASRSPSSFFLRSFRVMTPSFIIYSISRLSRDNGTFKPRRVSPFRKRQIFVPVLQCFENYYYQVQVYIYVNRHNFSLNPKSDIISSLDYIAFGTL